jgi:hypothetical protein
MTHKGEREREDGNDSYRHSCVPSHANTHFDAATAACCAFRKKYEAVAATEMTSNKSKSDVCQKCVFVCALEVESLSLSLSPYE